MASNWVATLSSLIGFAVVVLRLGPAFRKVAAPPVLSVEPKVSVIIPARNEERNLPRLLSSFEELDYQNVELIVVDDQSTDRTREVIETFCARLKNLKLVIGEERPVGWTGKNWACHQGVQKASGEYLLFTDADTEHLPESLNEAVAFSENEKLDLMSAIPFHRSESLWESLLGPFHLLILISTAAFSRPRLGRIFAIGQYLLFRRDAYFTQGGHEAIRGELCDDLELANRCLERGGRYKVDFSANLYHVRMYTNFIEFTRGWRRNIRLGFRHARLISTVEIYFVIAALTASMMFLRAEGLTEVMMFVTLAIFAGLQKRFGQFHFAGVVVFPFSLLIFVTVSALAVWDLTTGKAFHWRGRSYAVRSKSE